MSGESSGQADRPGVSPSGRGLGRSLMVIATAQLMVVLDDTIACRVHSAIWSYRGPGMGSR
jgi:hypothetical protein